ncbi:DNA cytosine methyltransferase [Leptospira levettii]|uniref:DNA cytosine methyltransferase n=1 Tax=Leptospira levettii TaxID=2023178 RepID=UPI00223DCDEC|nr:DNA cytosine methyltransferase [Leptospira levettii]MCW7498313.1 DNA cytosine methyltransferase [Leptospira levettii]
MRVLDFFCGAGGFSEGFRQCGFKIVQGYDHWKPAIDTFNYNFNLSCRPTNILDFNDIEKIENLPDTEIIIGSPPCVSFSNSNNSGKADKSHGIQLIKIYLKIIALKKFKKKSKLKAWFMENVPNSKKHLPDYFTFDDLGLSQWCKKNGHSPDDIAITLSTNSFILNSADFGSYQSRIRVFTGEVISSRGSKLSEILKIESKKKYENTIGKFFTKFPDPMINCEYLNFVKDPQYKLKIPKEELTDHFYDTGVYKIEWEKAKFLKINHPYMGKMSFPENLSKPSRTITATLTPHSRESLLYKSSLNRVGNGEFRTPTLREAAIFMGFPITFQFLGGENTKWRLVGNAVSCSVSRALAKSVIACFNVHLKSKLNISTNKNIEKIQNLNTFKIKEFNDPPIRKIGSRFRMHPIKDGNITVTLSNYCIKSNSKFNGRWYTSIQYGNGHGFPIQNVKDGIFNELDSLILSLEKGKEFLHIINNGFSGKIPNGKKLQTLYEKNINQSNYVNPTELISSISQIIQKLNIPEKYISKNEVNIFKFKEKIPAKQVFALYAINKITSIANAKK